MTLATLVSFSQAVGPLALPPMFPKLMEEFNCDLAGAVQFTGGAHRNHIRPPSRADLLDTTQPQIITDVMFLHERGAYNTLYFTTYFGALMVGPIIAGPMTDYLHWRHFWWLNVALLAAVNIALIFLFPETKWHRAHPDELANSDQASSKGGVIEKESETPSATTVEGVSEAQMEKGNVSRTETQADPYLGKGSPSKKQFKLWQINESPLKTMLIDFWTPWKLHAFPIVELGGIHCVLVGFGFPRCQFNPEPELRRTAVQLFSTGCRLHQLCDFDRCLHRSLYQWPLVGLDLHACYEEEQRHPRARDETAGSDSVCYCRNCLQFGGCFGISI
ncbi:predicted protein [Uncinocarpus reesii 1704]|uniref:Major facilitator superfamily (MFS) profile domain-containing protein n=1 Tax=Uncinocarpus reesii (strain UAMH 1704) TaxID=336963 RepID=C4JNJ1_UNCRE|nr:uncharacterized protein UREG_02989 [Uncinocarpus reesii 1704]EEP78144.1 predicted protein [Uncinocarpus reesii 1704]